MTFKIRGHRCIIGRTQGKTAQEVVAQQESKTDDCYGHWGGFGLGPLVVAVQVNHRR